MKTSKAFACLVLVAALALSACVGGEATATPYPTTVVGKVITSTYKNPANNHVYATYHVTVVVTPAQSVSIDKAVAHFNGLEITTSLPEGKSGVSIFEFDSNGYTEQLLRDAQGGPIVFEVTFYSGDMVVAGPYSAVLPLLNDIPPGGMDLEFAQPAGAIA